MTAIPLGEARDHLSEFVSDVERTHDRVTITRHGHRAAVLISAEELDSLEETIDILSTPGALEDIRAAQAELDAGQGVDIAEVGRMLTDGRRREDR